MGISSAGHEKTWGIFSCGFGGDRFDQGTRRGREAGGQCCQAPRCQAPRRLHSAACAGSTLRSCRVHAKGGRMRRLME
jgi:hypothetical protein